MDAAAFDRDELIALLDFQVAAGVDLALDDEPHDRFAESGRPAAPASRGAASAGGLLGAADPVSGEAREERPATTVRPATPALLAPAASAPPDEVAANARRLAAGAQSLDELEALVAAFDGCALKRTAKQLAFADGNPSSPVMLVGEAPGAEEDRAGKPFVGRAGQLLDRMLAAIGLDRSGVYIANVVPWRPPGNRTPTPQEVTICLPFIHRQIALASPRFLVTLGGAATTTLLGAKGGIRATRGRWLNFDAGDGAPIPALPMLHPAYLLRQPIEKRLAWRDLRVLRRAMDEAEPQERSST